MHRPTAALTGFSHPKIPGRTSTGARSPAWWTRWRSGSLGDLEAVVDGERGGSPTSSWVPRPPAMFTRGLMAAGVASGDRVAIGAPNCAEWVIGALGVLGAGCGAGPAQHPVQGGRGGPHPAGVRCKGPSLTVRGFLGVDYPALLAGEDLGDLERVVVVRRDDPAPSAPRRRPPAAAGDGRPPCTELEPSGHRRGGDPRAAAARAGAVVARRRLGPVVHLGHHRTPQGGHGHPRPEPAHLRHLGQHRRPPPGRPLPGGEPLLPHLRLQGGTPGQPHGRGHRGPRAGVRRGPGPRADRGRAHQRPPRAPHALPVPPGPPRPLRPRPVVVAPRGDRGGGGAG